MGQIPLTSKSAFHSNSAAEKAEWTRYHNDVYVQGLRERQEAADDESRIAFYLGIFWACLSACLWLLRFVINALARVCRLAWRTLVHFTQR